MTRSSQGDSRTGVLLLIAVLIAGGLLWWRHARSTGALDQVAHVPDEFNERQSQVDRAREIVDRLNRRRGDDAPQ